MNMLTEKATHLIWHATPQNKAMAGLQFACKLTCRLYKDINTGMLSLRAMSLVYTTLLSFVPLLALSFSVLKAFGVHNQLQPFLQKILAPLGAKGIEISQSIVLFVENMKVGVLGAVGLAVLIYTVISLIHKIESAFNSIWRITRGRSFAQRFSGYISIIVISPVLAFSAVGITATVTEGSIVQSIIGIEALDTTFKTLAALMPAMLTALIFTTLYMIIPNTRVQALPAIAAGLVTAFLWESAGDIFSIFSTGESNYDAIYSGFAIVIIFMIWLYLNWLIILLGASLSYYFQHPERVDENTSETLDCEKKRVSDALYVAEVLLSVQKSYPIKGATEESIQEALPQDVNIHNALTSLEDAGILVSKNNHTFAMSSADITHIHKQLWDNINKSVNNKTIHPLLKKTENP